MSDMNERPGAAARADTTVSDIYPCLYYRDATAAIAWLERAIGFQRRMVIEGPDDTVAHAELSLGNSVIMVGSSRKERGWLSPLDLEGVNQLLSVWVEDVDASYEQVIDAGGHIVAEIEETDYGARSFMIKDPEGNVWSIGDYRPGRYWDQE